MGQKRHRDGRIWEEGMGRRRKRQYEGEEEVEITGHKKRREVRTGRKGNY